MSNFKSLMKSLLTKFGNKYTTEHGVLIASWVSSDKSSWYRKYADGWIEQGGFIPVKKTAEISVTFPLAFATTYYTMYGQRATNDSSVSSPTIRQLAASRTRTTTGFTYIVGSNESSANWNWCAFGY